MCGGGGGLRHDRVTITSVRKSIDDSSRRRMRPTYCVAAAPLTRVLAVAVATASLRDKRVTISRPGSENWW